MYSIPLRTKPVTAIPARVASSSGGKGSGSRGIPTSTRAMFEALPKLFADRGTNQDIASDGGVAAPRFGIHWDTT